MQHVIRYVNGYLKIRVEGMYVERFLNMCNHHRIDLWNLRPVKHNYEMNISVTGFRKLKPILRKTQSKVMIIKRYGLPFFIHKYRKRSTFLFSFFLIIFLLYVSTFFLFQIDISGNLQYSEDAITEKLNKIEVHAGVRKESINCEKVSQYLRSEFDNITWASVYVSGTKLFIKIKEKYDQKERKEIYDEKKTNHIVADASGEIISLITRKGVPKVHIGDQVEEGDVLVSGEIEIKNDTGEIIDYQYVVPEAEIKIKTNIKYEDSIPLNYYEKIYTNKAEKLLCIETGEKVYCIGVNYLGSNMCVTSYKELINIGRIKIGMIRKREYKKVRERHNKKEYQRILNRNFEKFCEKLDKKGVQILENSVKIYSDSYCAFAKGNLCVSRNVGRIRAVEKMELKEGN